MKDRLSKIVLQVVLAFCLSLVFGSVSPPLLGAQQQDTSIAALSDISGTYTFLREGEFVQLTVEDGKLSGYVSRFGSSDSDKDQFIDQFFDKTTLEGDRLSFTTQPVHGVWYDFKGVIATVPGKRPGQEGYRVIRGKLVQHSTDDKGADKAKQREVEFKSFPAEVNR